MRVIFDMDGVILDSESIYLDAYQEISAKYGLDSERIHEAAVRSIGTTFETACEIMEEAMKETDGTCAHGITSDDVMREGREYFARTVAEGRLKSKPGVLECLAFLRQNGAVIGLASSSPTSLIEEELEKIGVLPFFDVIMSGDMVEHGKPDPEIFVRCAQEMGVPETEYGDVVVIEDSHNGIRAAHAAGMKPVMVPDLVAPTDEIRAMCAAVLPSLADVEEWIRTQ